MSKYCMNCHSRHDEGEKCKTIKCEITIKLEFPEDWEHDHINESYIKNALEERLGCRPDDVDIDFNP